MLKRLFFALCVVVLCCLPRLSFAVLNEADLSRTLQVLKDELALLQKEQAQNLARIRVYDSIQHAQMVGLMKRADEAALVLYSQNENYVFNITYACNEVTGLYAALEKSQRPYVGFIKTVEAKIDRYNRLIDALLALPSRGLPTGGNWAHPDSLRISASADSILASIASGQNASLHSSFYLSAEQEAIRDSCVVLATQFRNGLLKASANLKADYDQFQAVGEKLGVLNTYAEERYKMIRDDIFKNGDEGFVAMLVKWPYYLMLAIHDVREKYVLTGDETVSSSWKGPGVIFFAFFALFYLLVAVLLANVVFRFLVPAKRKTESVMKRKNYVITACAMLLFSAFLIGFRFVISDNFYQMGSELLVEFSLLMSVIVGSLIFRYEPDRIGAGLRVYLPVMSMGFVVILCRIIFVPSTVVSFVFPILLISLAFWQRGAASRYARMVPRSDIFYAWISTSIIIACCVCSWLGFTLFAVQIFTWWMMQLTCIHGLTCLYDYIRSYESNSLQRLFAIEYPDDVEAQRVAMEGYKERDGKHFQLTWVADFVNITLLPLLSAMSFPLCVYWASGIFDMQDTILEYLHNDFIDVEGVCSLSASKIVAVVATFYVFRFITYILHAVYARAIMTSEKRANKEANITLANNIISIACWGAYFIFALILLRVPKSGISLVTAGLATGIGFALKDVLNNFIYGLSLMAGRLRVGEMIECDGVRGRVESITYQSTQLQTFDGSVIAFLNSDLFAKSFKNLTRIDDFERVKLPIGVAYGSDINMVRSLLSSNISHLIKKESDGRFNISPDKGVLVALNDFGDSSVNLFVIVWVRIDCKTKTVSEINEVIYNVLNDNNIEIPFPQRVVYNK